MVIRSFKVFESYSSIHGICREYGIKHYSINEDGSIDVDDSKVYLFNKELKSIPLIFRNVNGNFNCHYNLLQSLEGSPRSIRGNFDCSNNQLVSFRGFPEYVRGYIFLIGNPFYEIFRLNQKMDFIEMLNEYDVIREDKVVEVRLRQALSDSGGNDAIDDFKFKYYKVI